MKSSEIFVIVKSENINGSIMTASCCSKSFGRFDVSFLERVQIFLPGGETEYFCMDALPASEFTHSVEAGSAARAVGESFRAGFRAHEFRERQTAPGAFFTADQDFFCQEMLV